MSRISTILGRAARLGSALRHVGAVLPSPARCAAGACRRMRLWLVAVLVVSACATPGPPADTDGSGGAGPAAAEPGTGERGAPAARGAETSQGEGTAVDGDSTIFFALASTVVDDAGREVLRRHAARLQSDPKLTVTLSGYTDDLGSREYNVALGQKRVDAVERELRALRVPGKQIRKRTYGYEKARPQRCTSDACRQSLRRVELSYTD